MVLIYAPVIMDMFIITKVVLFLLLPPSILILMMGVGFIIIKRHYRIGSVFIFAGFSMLYLLSIEPVSDTLIRPLESSFPSLHKVSLKSVGRPNLIVVLGGGAGDLSWVGVRPLPSRTSVTRLVCGITLYRQTPETILVISGGSGNPETPNISEAEAMKGVAVALGVASKAILLDEDSRNTVESAKNLKRLNGNKRIFVVTSAFHMKRAIAMFKKTGFDPIPVPCDYKSEQKRITIFSFIPHAGGLQNSSTAIYEYMSLLWYKLRGELS